MLFKDAYADKMTTLFQDADADDDDDGMIHGDVRRMGMHLTRETRLIHLLILQQAVGTYQLTHQYVYIALLGKIGI